MTSNEEQQAYMVYLKFKQCTFTRGGESRPLCRENYLSCSECFAEKTLIEDS